MSLRVSNKFPGAETNPQPSTSDNAGSRPLEAESFDSGAVDPQSTNSSSALLEAVDKLKFFLATAPGSFDPSTQASTDDAASLEDRCFNRFPLPTGEQISCVLWNGLYHITGTDIVRALNFRFLAFGRPVKNVKKFEEGIFSDLRNLKAGTDATLEEPKVGRTFYCNRSVAEAHSPERLSRDAVQAQLHSHPEETEGLLLVLCAT